MTPGCDEVMVQVNKYGQPNAHIAFPRGKHKRKKLQDLKTLNKMIMEIPVKKQMEMIKLFCEGYSYKEIAMVYNIPISSVGTCIYLARAYLKKVMTK